MARISMSLLFVAGVVFAGEPMGMAPIHNVCDTLKFRTNPSVTLRIDYIDETNWFGNPHGWIQDSVHMQRYESSQDYSFKGFEDISISNSNAPTRLPVEIQAGCQVNQAVRATFASWSSYEGWAESVYQDYVTSIYDANESVIAGLSLENSYNWLLFTGNDISAGYSPRSDEIMISRSLDFSFEWWYAGKTFLLKRDEKVLRYYSSATGFDSAMVVNAVKNRWASNPDSVNVVRIQILKVVLRDAEKLVKRKPSIASEDSPIRGEVLPSLSASDVAYSSGGEMPEVTSSGSVGVSAGSVGEPNSIGGNASLVGEISPVSSNALVEISSNSVGALVPQPSGTQSNGSIISWNRTSRVYRGMPKYLRLDGTPVRSGERLQPGIYYVKSGDGRWLKKAVLSR